MTCVLLPIPTFPGWPRAGDSRPQDVVFSLNRLRDPQVASSGRWILDALDNSSEGEGLVARGLDTVEFKLKQPFPPFLGLLATAYANVVAPEAVVYFGAGFPPQSRGVGAVQIGVVVGRRGVRMHRNEGYWERDDAGEQLPYMDAVHISFASDMGAEYQGLLQGKFDFMSGLHPAYMEELLEVDGTLREEHAPTVRMETTPFLKTDYIGFFVEPSAQGWYPWQDEAVRNALSLAIDREGIARSLRRGTVVPTRDFVPPALVGRSAPRPSVYDVERARAVIDSVAAEHPRPWPELVLSTTSEYTDLCAALQFQWESIGLEVGIDVVAPATHRERVANGKAMAFRKSWLADYPDAENFLSLFRTANHAPSGPNYTHYSDAGFDARLDSAMAEPDASNRLALYDDLNGMVSQALPLIPLFHDQVTHFVRHDVQGWEINSVNRLDLRRVRKTPALN